MRDILEAFGYQATLLDVQDIYNHALMTAEYDVFVLPDNLPRENITNCIYEFWLGGGAILALDGSAMYLCYMGMLPPEASGTSGQGAFWSFSGNDINITSRHPVSKSYSLGDVINTKIGYLRWDWTALQGSVIASDLTRVARSQDDPDTASVLAFDPTDRGGKIVTIAQDLESDELPELDQMLGDAVEWLCPNPKGRILYDLSHLPYEGIDPWDTLAVQKPYYAEWRNALVNRSYTFDKLYPSATGNLTTSNLVPYDMLIVVLPRINFTSLEVTVVTNWIAEGGGLIAIGDSTAFATYNSRTNYLLSNLDLLFNLNIPGASDTLDYYVMHPTTEGCEELTAGAGPGLVNYSGSAYPIWGYDASNFVIAAQKYGAGRVICCADRQIFSNYYIDEEDNYQYAVNVINWLSATTAEVLIYVDTPGTGDPNSNVYRGPVAQALNDLGIPFYLTFDGIYFNLSLYNNNWELVIFDNIWFGSAGSYFSDILNYLKTGSKLIISTWLFSSSSGISLWDYIGFSYTGTYFSTPPTIYLWDSDHSIFNIPVDYNAGNISTNLNFVFTDCQNLTRYTNATAIAGLGPSQSTTNASIIIGAGGRAIANGMLLTEYMSDTDDSTYPDAVEIWKNEIQYIIATLPESNNPSDQTVEKDAVGSIPWILTDVAGPGSYRVLINNTPGPWNPWTNNTLINFPINTTAVGVFNYTIEYNNLYGKFGIPDTVMVTVTKPPIPGFLFLYVIFGIVSLVMLKKKVKIKI
ncbi:MAG: DUF4350 domain-containing protein [Promethearchaeota archaeon]